MTAKTTTPDSRSAKAVVKHNSGSDEFNEEYVRRAVNQTVEDVIGESAYVHDSTTKWTNQIVEGLVRTFVGVAPQNKFIVTCMVVQKSDAGMRSATSCFWNAQTDSGHSIT